MSFETLHSAKDVSGAVASAGRNAADVVSLAKADIFFADAAFLPVIQIGIQTHRNSMAQAFGGVQR